MQVLINMRSAARIKPGITVEALRAKYPQKTILELDYWPDQEQLGEWVMDGVCEATDGCTVEPDGHCEHRHPSWLLALGMI